jgi:mannose-6-phosphate isomerase
LLKMAIKLLTRLDQTLRHALGGYEEANPRRLPLRSNPHMHLLEALLAWVAADGEPTFRGRALGIVNLATSAMIDQRSGGIAEYFDHRLTRRRGQRARSSV